MSKVSRRVRLAAFAAACAACAWPAALAIASAPSNSTRHVPHAGPTAAATATKTSRAGSDEAQATQVWMAVRQQAAQQFVNASSTPGTETFRQFLSPNAYTERFGPSATQVQAVESYLTRKHFTRVYASVNDDYVSGIAPAADHSALRIPASLSHDVLAVTGRNDAQVKANISAGKQTTTAEPATRSAASPAATSSSSTGCSRYWGQKTEPISPAFDGVTEAAVPVCGYSAEQIRQAYGLSASDTGHGETIALIQDGGPARMRQTLTDWAKRNGLPAPKPGQYREETVGAGADSTCPNEGQVEGTLDSEVAYATAPGANQLMVDGDDCDQNDYTAQAIFDAMLAPLTGHGPHPSASIENLCFSPNINHEAAAPRSLVQVSHAIVLRAAAEGVSLLVASGDGLGIVLPASDPDATAVGGTTLGIGADGQRLFETGWSTRFGARTGTSSAWANRGVDGGPGGGVSALYPEPGYQRGVVPRSMAWRSRSEAGRVVPDISADADGATGMLVGVVSPTGRYSTFTGDGTSMATPLIAGIVADAEQGQPRSFGLLNPSLYSMSGTRAINDIRPLSPSDPQVDRAFYRPGAAIHGKPAPTYVGINGSATTKRATLPGYDTITGLGTPDGSYFIRALRAGK